jgi:hypothetical protein
MLAGTGLALARRPALPAEQAPVRHRDHRYDDGAYLGGERSAANGAGGRKETA